MSITLFTEGECGNKFWPVTLKLACHTNYKETESSGHMYWGWSMVATVTHTHTHTQQRNPAIWDCMIIFWLHVDECVREALLSVGVSSCSAWTGSWGRSWCWSGNQSQSSRKDSGNFCSFSFKGANTKEVNSFTHRGRVNVKPIYMTHSTSLLALLSWRNSPLRLLRPSQSSPPLCAICWGRK